jgi:hypothetical protein
VRGGLASLWWTEIFAWSRSTRTGTASLLDAQGAAFDNFTLKTFLSSVGLFSSNHLHKAEATGLLGMGIEHDLALLDIAVFREETGNLGLGETRMDTSDEEVGAWVDSTVILGSATVILGWATGLVSGKNETIGGIWSMRVDAYRLST